MVIHKHHEPNIVCRLQQVKAAERGGLVWTHRTIEESTFDQVCKLANDGYTQKEIVQELGIHKSGVSRYVKRAKTEMKIDVTGCQV